jgi:hypothetical protein
MWRWSLHTGIATEPVGAAGGLATQVLPRLESRRTFQWSSSDRSASTVVARGLTIAAIAVGVALRAWYVFHQPIGSDEAVVGLMVQQILHGHFTAFYWGQVYGGGEAYLVAPVFAVFGSSAGTLQVVPITLAAAAAIVTCRIARHLVASHALAALAGAVVWVVPQSAVMNSTQELGFRGVTLLCGLSLVLVALHIYEGQQTWPAFAGLGLLAGIGWWSSPEIIYYAVPAAWLVVAVIRDDPEVQRLRRWSSRLLVAVVAAVIGALPWVWANINSGFRSLHPGSFAVPPNEPSYLGRLHIFFQFMLPMLFSFRAELTGAWLWFRPAIFVVILLLALVGVNAVVLCLIRDVPSRALAVAVLLFPFLLAVSPATWFWGDGRYANLGVPLIVLVLLVGCEEVGQRGSCLGRLGAKRCHQGRVQRFTTIATMFTLLAFSVANFAAFMAPAASFFTGWTNPNGPSLVTVAELEAHHIRYAYADYWVAYKLDFLGDGRLQITTAGTDVDRWQAQHVAVRQAKSVAWLFTTPTGEPAAQFGLTTSIQGPNGMSETQFLTELVRLGVGYHVVQAGLVQAVIPDRRITYTEVGLVRTNVAA